MKTIRKNLAILTLALFGFGIIGNNVLFGSDTHVNKPSPKGAPDLCDAIWEVTFKGGFPDISIECTTGGNYVCPFCPDVIIPW